MMKTASLVALPEEESEASGAAVTGAPSEHAGSDAEKRSRLADIVGQYRVAHGSNIRAFDGEALARNQFDRRRRSPRSACNNWAARPY